MALKEMRFIKRMTSRLLLTVLTLAFLTSGQFIKTPRAAAEEPAYSASWRVTGPTGGDVRALVVDPGDPDRFYFGTLDGQLYASTDAGHSWRLLKISTGPTCLSTTSSWIRVIRRSCT